MQVGLQFLHITGAIEYNNKYQSSILGQYYCLDHTYQVCKRVHGPDGALEAKALLTIMNEKVEIVAFFATQTTSLKQVKCGLEKCRALLT
jgi:hypothetical protein